MASALFNVAPDAVWKNRAVIDPPQDAFGAALLDYLEGKDVPELVLEDRGGWTGPAMHPEWFFRSFAQWDWWDRKMRARG